MLASTVIVDVIVMVRTFASYRTSSVMSSRVLPLSLHTCPRTAWLSVDIIIVHACRLRSLYLVRNNLDVVSYCNINDDDPEGRL